MTDENLPRPLYLSVRLEDSPHAACLLLDARDPSHLSEAPDLDHLDALPDRSVVIIDGRDAEPTVSTDGHLLVSRGLLWSLLDPVEAGRRARVVVSDRLAAEQTLRTEGRRLWEGLDRWRGLPPDLSLVVRGLLASFSRPLAEILDLLATLSESGRANPFGGWEEPVADPIAGASKPEARPLPDDPHELADWMIDPEGLGILHGEGFQPREGQGDMARDVVGALDAAHPILIEAGTGIGKTLAYLAPLLARLARSEERAIVSTYTRTLQHQIIEQDLPRLLPVASDVVARPLMGRSNYLCRTRLVRFLERPVENLADAWAVASFRLWLQVTTDGRREEVEDHPALRPHLRELFDSPEPCSPTLCYGRSECYVQKARRLAREARLVVVNHSLLMHDFAAGHTLVGEYDALVVDEAHRLPQVALDCYEVRCDHARAVIIEDLIGPIGRGGSLPRLPRLLCAELSRAGERASSCVPALEAFSAAVGATVKAYRRWLEALSARFDGWIVDGARPQGKVRVQDRDDVFGPISRETTSLLVASGEADTAYAAFARLLEGLPGIGPELEDDLATLARTAELLTQLERDVIFLTGREDPDWVVWLDPDSREGLRAAGATLLESGPLLADLWRGSDLQPVLTSATLGVGEDFSYMARELGVSALSRHPVASLVPSPFSYDEQSLFLTTPDFPAPDERAYLPSVSRLLESLLVAVPRKTMVLFTSYAALKVVAEALQDEQAEGYEFKLDLDRHWGRRRPVILTQGSGLSPAELMARFRRESRAVLLGTNTFWEGIDLPGAHLEVLVVTKLPFLVPADPWVAARCERMQAEGENPFTRFMVRDAVLRLRQGIGRLIRSDRDRGVVVLLDSRLHTKPYGKTFLDAMPTSVRYCADPDSIVADATSFFEGS